MITKRRLLTSVAAAGFVAAAPAILRGQTKMVIRFPHTTPEVHPTAAGANEFKKAMEELVPEVEMRIFPNRQLGDDRQLLEQTVAGTLDIAISGAILFPLVTNRPALDSFQLPFLIRSYEHFHQLATSDVANKMFEDLNQAGLVGLSVYDVGQRHFLSVKKPVKTTADFKGLKTRIVPVPLHKAMWEAVGTTPIGLNYGEVYSALSTGVIDAVEINVSSVISENLWEKGKYFTLTGHYFWPAVIMANKNSFEKWPKKVQDAMREAGKRAALAGTMYSKKLDFEGRDLLKAKGIEISDLQDLDNMRKIMAPLLKQWGDKHPLIADFIKAAERTA